MLETKPFRCLKQLVLAAAVTLCLHTACAPAQTADRPPTPAELQQAAQPTHTNTWWKHAVFYEIYPRSFQDSNGDGIGDLNGITSRLGYLQHLGVNAIWIAPMYPSPQVDFGYDISNYTAVDSQYGTLADFDHLVAAARAHHIRIILDMVLNHTSSKHPWFLESASSRTNPKADWYCWNDGVPANAPGVTAYQKRFAVPAADGKQMVPPNNWESLFGGSAWTWVPARQQFYYHKFYKQQPDLNWRNPAVEKAMFAAMRFWLDRGVAGFRLDAITTLFEDPQLRDEPVIAPGVNAYGDPYLSDNRTNMLPELHGVLRRLREMADSYPANIFPGPRVLIGETYVPSTSDLAEWYGGHELNELQLPMDTLVGFHTEGGAAGANVSLDLAHFRTSLTDMQTELDGGWPLLVFANHDNPRSWDRFTNASETYAQKVDVAKIIASVLLTTRAAALMYYGEELGMKTHTPTRKQDVRDPIGITGWPREKGRDGERTPMQWTPGPQADFSTDPHTWLPVGNDYKTTNVQTESADPNSLLNWYRELIALRRDNPALHNGGTVMIDNTNPSVLSWVRTAPTGAHAVVVSLNMTPEPQHVHLNLNEAHLSTEHTHTLFADAPSLNAVTSVNDFTIPPFGSFIAEVQ